MAIPTLTANSPIAGSIAWTQFVIQYGGVGYTVPAGSTANRCVWWRYNNGAPTLESGAFFPLDTAADKLGPDDLALFINKNGVPANLTAATIIDGSLIASESIITSKLAADAVTADKIAANAVSTAELAADAVTADKIAANAVSTAELAADAVTADKILAGAISTDKIAANAVTADKIAANAVSTEKLAADAVTADKIAANAVSTAELAANAVTADKILAGAISTDKIAANAVTADKIAANSVTAAELAADLLISSTIRTGGSGQRRVVLSAPTTNQPGGIQLLAADDSALVDLPLNGEPAVFRGAGIFTDGLTVEGPLEIVGSNNAVAVQSTVQLGSGVAAPATAPTAATSYPTTPFDTTSLYGLFAGCGDAVYAANPWLFTGMASSGGIFGEFSQIIRYAGVDQWTTLPTWTASTATVWNLLGAPTYAYIEGIVAVSATRVRVLGKATNAHPTVADRGKWFVWDLTLTPGATPTVTVNARAPWTNPGSYTPDIGRGDGCDFVTAAWNTSDQIVFTGWTQSGSTLTQAWTKTTGTIPAALYGTTAATRTLSGVYRGSDVDVTSGATTYTAAFNGNVQFFDANGALLPQHAFPTPSSQYLWTRRGGSTTSSGFGGFTGPSSTNYGTLVYYTAASWTTEPTTWYAAYTYTGPSGAETTMSPPRAFTMPKRGQVTLSAPPIPAAATGVNFYLARPTSGTPTRSDFHKLGDLVATDTVGGFCPVTRAAYDGLWTAAAPPAAITGFTPGAPATIHSQNSDTSGPLFAVRGDGSGRWLALEDLLTPVGSLAPYAGAGAPTGWLACNGQAVSRTTYARLFAVLGTSYGAGDGSNTFNLPNLTDRVPLGAGVNARGVTGGTKTLTAAHLPPHAHTINHSHTVRRSNTTTGASATVVASGVTAAEVTASSDMVPAYTGSSGNGPGTSADLLPPFQAVNWIIRHGA